MKNSLLIFIIPKLNANNKYLCERIVQIQGNILKCILEMHKFISIEHRIRLFLFFSYGVSLFFFLFFLVLSGNISVLTVRMRINIL